MINLLQNNYMRKFVHVKIFAIYLIIATLFLISACGGGGGESSHGVSSSDTTGSSSITLEWDAPQANVDGSGLTDLAGYKIYYGTSSDIYTQYIDVGNTTNSTIDNLSAGIWCFATTAYNTAGNESDYSNQICTSI